MDIGVQLHDQLPVLQRVLFGKREGLHRVSERMGKGQRAKGIRRKGIRRMGKGHPNKLRYRRGGSV